MLNRRTFVGAILATAVASLTSTQTFAAEDAILTVNGLGEALVFSQADLEAIGSVTFDTTTIWTEGTQTFTGVPLNLFVQSLGVESGVLLASAVNDYTIEFPVEDALKEGAIIAFLRNGETMSVRDKGPLWIVYPYDSNEDFQSEEAYSRSIWQLDRIEVKN